MTRDDASRFGEVMAAMTENYPGTQLTSMGLKMRFDSLQDYSIDQVTNSALELMRTHKYNTMPTVGDFVAALDLAEGKISIEDRAEIEAGKLLNHLRKKGSVVTPVLDDPVSNHLMRTVWCYTSWARRVKEDAVKDLELLINVAGKQANDIESHVDYAALRIKEQNQRI